MIEEKKKPQVEILSPAGSYESFLAAIHAGADAVYARGPRFGARAFADNFTEETLKQADQNAKLAIMMILSGLDRVQAEALLEKHQGKLQLALK